MEGNAILTVQSGASDMLDAEQSQPPPTLMARACRTLRQAVDRHFVGAQVGIDGSGYVACLIAAFAIRFEGAPTGDAARSLLLWLPMLPVVRLAANCALGVYRRMWRFYCLCDALLMSWSLVLVSLALLGFRAVYPPHFPLGQWLRLPFSVIMLEFLLSLTLSMGARVGRRLLHERTLNVRRGFGHKSRRVILYGAGQAGVLLVRELVQVPEIEVVGFVDDDPNKVGTLLSGVRVLGTGEALGRIVRDTDASEVVISIVMFSPGALTGILAKCRRIPIPAKIVPSMRELLNKEAEVTDFRDIRVEDLLGRDEVKAGNSDGTAMDAYRGKRIVVTGAGGSIGSELTRQLLLLGPEKITILDKDENSIYDLEQELKFRNVKVPIEAVIADLKILERVRAVLAEARPHVVFHAAAHKHVPLMEMQPCEAVLNNVMGTENVLKACQMAGTERFVFISTDKAVNPTNIMGATKRVGENIVRMYTNIRTMKTATVRFGNVMGSRGSVVPLFLKQIKAGGPITVTHPEIVRYFMTIPEAVQLVVRAGSVARGGEVFILDMGTPRKITDVARQMIMLCGLEPDKDIEIAYTGLRPGEKMNEELVADNETILPTPFEKISVVAGAYSNLQAFRACVDRLIAAALANDTQLIYELLTTMELGFRPTSRILNRKRPQYTDYGAARRGALAKAATA